MFCPKCGAQNEEDAKFCESCGFNLATDENQTSKDQDANQTSKGLFWDKPKLMVAAAAAIILMLLGGLAIAALRSDKESSSTQAPSASEESSVPKSQTREALLLISPITKQSYDNPALKLGVYEVDTKAGSINQLSSLPIGFKGAVSYKDSTIHSSLSISTWKYIYEESGIIKVRSFIGGGETNLNWKKDEFSATPKFTQPTISPDGTTVSMISEDGASLYIAAADGDGKDSKKVLDIPKNPVFESSIKLTSGLPGFAWSEDSASLIGFQDFDFIDKTWTQRQYNLISLTKAGTDVKVTSIVGDELRVYVCETFSDKSGFLAYVREGKNPDPYGSNQTWKPKTDFEIIGFEGSRTPLPALNTILEKFPFEDTGIFTTSIDTEVLKELVFSQDNQKIVFSSKGDIWVLNMDGTSLLNVTNSTDRKNSLPIWSPSGSQIAFLSSPTSSSVSEVWVMNKDGSNRQKLSNVPQEGIAALAWGTVDSN